MTLRTKIIAALLITLIIVGAGVVLLPGEETSGTRAYSLGEVARGTLKVEVSATGTLSPVITVQVGSQVSGTIEHLHADFNSVVKKGQVIAQIDPAIFKAKLSEAEASVHSSRAARDKAQVIVEETTKALSRITDLYRKKLASEDEQDTARFARQAALAELQVKEAEVAQAEAARQREEVNLAYTTIYAPIDGVVISRNVDVGQTVAASLQAPTLFTIAQDLARMQIETEVDEAFIGMITEQQPVKFTVFAYQDRNFTGRVSQVRLQPKVEAGVVKYNCIIHVDNADLALKPGMTATVSIEVNSKDDVLKVPNAALRFVPDWPAERLDKVRTKLQSNEAFLWLPEGDEIAPQKVHTGLVGEQETEISGAGLQAGTTIVLPAERKETKSRRRFGLSLF